MKYIIFSLILSHLAFAELNENLGIRCQLKHNGVTIEDDIVGKVNSMMTNHQIGGQIPGLGLYYAFKSGDGFSQLDDFKILISKSHDIYGNTYSQENLVASSIKSKNFAFNETLVVADLDLEANCQAVGFEEIKKHSMFKYIGNYKLDDAHVADSKDKVCSDMISVNFDLSINRVELENYHTYKRELIQHDHGISFNLAIDKESFRLTYGKEVPVPMSLKKLKLSANDESMIFQMMKRKNPVTLVFPKLRKNISKIELIERSAEEFLIEFQVGKAVETCSYKKIKALSL